VETSKRLIVLKPQASSLRLQASGFNLQILADIGTVSTSPSSAANGDWVRMHMAAMLMNHGVRMRDAEKVCASFDSS